MTCLREGTLPLSDGRRLGFGEYGRRDGTPVLFFHGGLGGRAHDLGGALLAEHGLWLFVLERPGFGLSDPRPGAGVLDWPGDVADVANQLGFERFAVAGASAGAIYALACGHSLASRVTTVVLLAADLYFVDEPEFDVLLSDDTRRRVEGYRADPQRQPKEEFAWWKAQCDAWAEGPEAFYRQFFGDAADVLPDYWVRCLESAFGSVRRTPADFAVQFQPWGFSPDDVPVPVRAWHGDADEVASIGLVEELIRRVPDGDLTVCAGAGHFLHPRYRSEYFAALANAR